MHGRQGDFFSQKRGVAWVTVNQVTQAYPRGDEFSGGEANPTRN